MEDLGSHIEIIKIACNRCTDSIRNRGDILQNIHFRRKYMNLCVNRKLTQTISMETNVVQMIFITN